MELVAAERTFQHLPEVPDEIGARRRMPASQSFLRRDASSANRRASTIGIWLARNTEAPGARLRAGSRRTASTPAYMFFRYLLGNRIQPRSMRIEPWQSICLSSRSSQIRMAEGRLTLPAGARTVERAFGCSDPNGAVVQHIPSLCTSNFA